MSNRQMVPRAWYKEKTTPSFTYNSTKYFSRNNEI